MFNRCTVLAYFIGGAFTTYRWATKTSCYPILKSVIGILYERNSGGTYKQCCVHLSYIGQHGSVQHGLNTKQCCAQHPYLGQQCSYSIRTSVNNVPTAPVHRSAVLRTAPIHRSAVLLTAPVHHSVCCVQHPYSTRYITQLYCEVSCPFLARLHAHLLLFFNNMMIYLWKAYNVSKPCFPLSDLIGVLEYLWYFKTAHKITGQFKL